LPVRHLVSRPRDKAAALNAGIAAAKTEWLAFTDDDTLPEPDWLLQGMRYAETAGGAIFGGRIIAPELDDSRLPRWLRPGRSGRLPGTGIVVRYRPRPDDGPLRLGMPAPFGANLFARRDVFARHGGYDENLWALCVRYGKWPVGVEDSEFGHRLIVRGEPVGYCDGACVVHPVNYCRASLRLCLWQAYCDGWRQPLIFTEQVHAGTWRYRVRRLLGELAGTAWSGITGDPSAAAAALLDAARYAGMLVGVSSAALAERRRMINP